MKYCPDFEISHISFASRIGRPTEFDAAIGRVALAFSGLEDATRNVILLLSGTDRKAAHIMTAQLSFRQKVDVLASLGKLRIETAVKEDERLATAEHFAEIMSMCQKAEEMRNTYIHSSYEYYGRGRKRTFRAKFSARARHGLNVSMEKLDASLLLDVHDYVMAAAEEVEGIPLLLDIADAQSGVGNQLQYTKNGSVVAEFRFGQVE
jgi:hypothetical protein